MTEEFRSKAEEFVIEFLKYVDAHDIHDYFNKKTQKMEESPGVTKLIKSAREVFPARADDGKVETDKLTPEQVDEAVKTSENVIDRREDFSKRIAKNGGTHRLLRRLYDGDESAMAEVADFFAAEDGKKEFDVSPKV